MRIGYGKFARSWELDPGKASTVGGDIDVSRLLRRLATALPKDDLILVGRCKGGEPGQYDYPKNVYNPWYSDSWELPMVTYREGLTPEDYLRPRNMFRELTRNVQLDALVLWIGQVANANSPIPPSKADWENCDLTNPQVMAVNYTLYLVDLCNRLGIEPILLCPDPRNYWKPRELTRPLRKPILGQYAMSRTTRHEQYQDWGRPWQAGHVREGSQIVASTHYEYAGVELTALDNPSEIRFELDTRREHLIGIITNENKVEVPEAVQRVTQLQKYVLTQWPDAPIYGKWSEASMKLLGQQVEPVPYTQMYDTLRQFRCTMTFPASGSGWATAKAWEAFAVGTVMFFHHAYDDQGHILPRSGSQYRKLRKFLVIHNQRQLWQRVAQLEKDDELFREIITQQRELFENMFYYWQGGARRVLERLEEERIG